MVTVDLHGLLRELPEPEDADRSGVAKVVEGLKDLTRRIEELQEQAYDVAETVAPEDYRSEIRRRVRDRVRPWRIQLDVARHAAELWRGESLGQGVWHSVFAAATALEPQMLDPELLKWTRYLMLASLCDSATALPAEDAPEWAVIGERLLPFVAGSGDWLDSVPRRLIRAAKVPPGAVRSALPGLKECASAVVCDLPEG